MPKPKVHVTLWPTLPGEPARMYEVDSVTSEAGCLRLINGRHSPTVSVTLIPWSIIQEVRIEIANPDVEPIDLDAVIADPIPYDGSEG
jgi:hypothetical protein